MLGHAVRQVEGLWSSGSELRRGGPPFGALQRCTRSARIAGACLLLAATMATHSLGILVGIYFLCALLALVSYIEIGRYLGRNLLIVGALALPMAVFGSLSWVTPGETFVRVGPVHFSHQGARSVAFVVLRSLDAVSITMLLVRSAGVHGVLRGLRELRVPAGVVAALQMAVGHMHVLARTAVAMMMALRCRTLGTLTTRTALAAAGTQGAVLFQKSLGMSRDVHAAMLARGFDGTFPDVDRPARWGAPDAILMTAAALVFAAALVWR